MRLFFILFSFLSLSAIAQEPAHVIIGSKELSIFEIYDLTQDQQGHLILATDKGLLRYDAYDFKELPLPKQARGSSVFGFSRNLKGELFCHNLNGQLFKVVHDHAELAYQLPDSLSSNTYSIIYDKEGNLIANCRHPYMISPNGDYKPYVIENRYSWTVGSDSELYTYECNFNTLLVSNPTGIKEIKFNQAINKNCPFPGRIQAFGQDKYAFVGYQDSVIRVMGIDGTVTMIPMPDAPGTIYNLGKKGYWIAMSKGGVCVLDQDLNPQFKGKVLFKNEFISSAMVDNQGRVVLGTFNRGIIFITNPGWTIFPDFNESNRVSFITPIKENGILAGTYSGQILKLDTNLQASIQVETDNRIVSLHHIPGENQVLYNFDKGTPVFLDLNSGSSTIIKSPSIKGVAKLKGEQYLLATSKGIRLYNLQKNIESFEKITEKGRALSVIADTINEIQYFGLASGLQIRHNDITKDTTLKVLVSSFSNSSDTVYAGTVQNGIIIINQGKLIGNITKKDGLADNEISKLVTHGGKLYVSTRDAFQILDLNSNNFQSMGQSEGFPSGEISDFFIHQNYLWVLSQKGLQFISLFKVKDENLIPDLKFKQILVNDGIISFDVGNQFNHKQRQFKFELSCISFTAQDQIGYKYKLEGIDKQWQYQPFDQNVITYKSLPPGEYKLSVLPVKENIEGEPIFYEFVIKPAVWQTWWFYLVLLILFSLLSFTIYRWYMERRIKSIKLQNELSQSKLTAIRSQMNPHFIFNALNSIQDLVLKKEIEHAYTYITKFANLVRKTLNYSEREFVDFEQEVQLIELYLSLEKLRFKSGFEYKIETNGISDLKVAPLLIQPFIENALVHGLLHKEGEKRIEIEFELGESLICRITDNGIGREESARIRNRQRRGHDSFSTQAIRNRLEILKQLYDGKVGLEYEDIKENRKATGTRVSLFLPYERSF